MYSGDSLEVKTSVNLFGIGNPGSLRGCQRQSQTGAMSSGGSLEVESGLNSFGTGFLKVCEGAKSLFMASHLYLLLFRHSILGLPDRCQI